MGLLATGTASILCSTLFFTNKDERFKKENQKMGYLFLFYGVFLVIFAMFK